MTQSTETQPVPSPVRAWIGQPHTAQLIADLATCHRLAPFVLDRILRDDVKDEQR